MKANTIKFYMNNPCEVIRSITEDFSEVKVYPQYLDESTNGGDWCTVCQCGAPDGAHPKHDCDVYQDVIDYINDSEVSMIIVVENRLLQDHPVEFKAWKQLREETNSYRDEKSTLWREIQGLKRELEEQSKLLQDTNTQITEAQSMLSDEREGINILQNRKYVMQNEVNSLADSISVGGIKLSLGAGQLRDLIEASITLEYLERGGVDNWEWYSESLPDDLDSLVDEEIKSFKVVGI